MKVWTYIETSTFDYELRTIVKLFKNESDIREYFKMKRDEEYKAVMSWGKDISTDFEECNDGDIYIHSDNDNEFGYWEVGYASECECSMRIELKEVE